MGLYRDACRDYLEGRCPREIEGDLDVPGVGVSLNMLLLIFVLEKQNMV